MNEVAYPPAGRRNAWTFRTTLIAMSCAIVMSAEPAFAQSGNPFGPIETAVQMIVDFVTGPFGRLVAIIAVFGLGFLAFIGRLSWITAFAVLIGFGLVFGAPAIVDQLIAAVGS